MKPRKMIQKKVAAFVFPEGKLPGYKDIHMLSKFISERGKILGRAKTGVTAKQQRILTTAIKNARHVGLLPFIVR